MTVEFSQFIKQLTSSLPFLITTLIMLSVMMVNGWTDAPMAIATCVGTRSMRPGSAIILSAVFNFLGVLVMTLVNATVAKTIYNMVDFGSDPRIALIGLMAGLTAIVVWALVAWRFGINTSESHALIAGVSGAAIAIQGGLSGINGSEWVKVLYGLALSTLLGFASGWVSARLMESTCKNINKPKTDGFFRWAQIGGAAGTSFMHGAQDGQKFMGVFMLGMFLSMGNASGVSFTIPIWLMVLCSAVIALGTSIGGYRILKTVGFGMVRLKKYQGFAADLASTGSLLLTSFLGIPVSTSHMKTTAILGVGASRRMSAIKWSVVLDMTLAWVLTFPCCGLIGYLTAKLFTLIF